MKNLLNSIIVIQKAIERKESNRPKNTWFYLLFWVSFEYADEEQRPYIHPKNTVLVLCITDMSRQQFPKWTKTSLHGTHVLSFNIYKGHSYGVQTVAVNMILL